MTQWLYISPWDVIMFHEIFFLLGQARNFFFDNFDIFFSSPFSYSARYDVLCKQLESFFYYFSWEIAIYHIFAQKCVYITIGTKKCLFIHLFLSLITIIFFWYKCYSYYAITRICFFSVTFSLILSLERSTKMNMIICIT